MIPDVADHSHLSVAEAAELLSVHPQRIHQRIRAGSLPAQKLGNQWVVRAADVHHIRHHRRRGRPLTHHSAWAVIAVAAELCGTSSLYPLRPGLQKKAAVRLGDLVSEDSSAVDIIAARLVQTLRGRATRHQFVAAALDLPDLRQDGRVLLSGVSLPQANLSAAGIVEGYVRIQDLPEIAAEYLLTPATSNESNVVLHALPAAESEPTPESLKRLLSTPLVVAADLAEHDAAREQQQAALLVHEVARRFAQVQELHA